MVKAGGPITGEEIAQELGVTRSAIRSDLSFLTQLGLLDAKPRVGYSYRERSHSYDIYMRMIDMRVSDYLSPPTVVRESASAYDALVALFMNNIGTLIVVNDGGTLEGVLSRKDLLKLAVGSTDMHQVPAGVVMTRMPNVVMTHPDESLWAAAQKLIRHEIDGMPVVGVEGSEGYKILGRFTKTNVTQAFVDMGYGQASEV